MRERDEHFEDLRQEGESPDISAETLGGRSSPACDPGWTQLVQLLCLSLVLGGAIFLLIAEENRRRWVAGAAEKWIRVSQKWEDSMDRESKIFKLPPPPPKTAEPRVLVPSVAIVQQPSQVLYAEGTAVTSGEDEEEKTYVAPQKTPESEKAHKILTTMSETARKLVANSFAQYQYKEWKLVKSDPPKFWIEFIALQKSDGREIHFIWAVETESGEIRALSQAARDLERETADSL